MRMTVLATLATLLTPLALIGTANAADIKGDAAAGARGNTLTNMTSFQAGNAFNTAGLTDRPGLIEAADFAAEDEDDFRLQSNSDSTGNYDVRVTKKLFSF